MNKVTYLARVIKADKNWYAIDFPDLPGTHAQCRKLSDVQGEAEDALCNYLLAAKTVGEKVADPSPSLLLNKDEMAVIITADLDSFQRRHDNTPVRKTVSIPRWMADGAERKKISLSKTLQSGLAELLSH